MSKVAYARKGREQYGELNLLCMVLSMVAWIWILMVVILQGEKSTKTKMGHADLADFADDINENEKFTQKSQKMTNTNRWSSEGKASVFAICRVVTEEDRRSITRIISHGKH